MRRLRKCRAISEPGKSRRRTAEEGSTGQARGCLHCGGQRFESPPVHHEVRAFWHDFLRHRIPGHSRGLRRQQSVCQAYSTVSAAHWRRAWSKVSGRKIPFPRLLFATVSTAPDFKRPVGAELRGSTGSGWMDQPLAGRQTRKGGSFLMAAPAHGVRACATDPARPSRSTRCLRPKPRGRRPSTAALTISGARKASDRVIRIERSVLPSREASDSKVAADQTEVRRASDGHRQELRSGSRARWRASGGRGYVNCLRPG